MKTPDFTIPIRRALSWNCETNFLAPHRSLGFSDVVRLRLSLRNQTVDQLAGIICRPRNSVSLVIHGRRRIPAVEALVRKELGL